ncbi:MAG: hypothetical protein OEW77_08250 [Gemmatimonadota bacterium]|nr:hypothetical protein [Gemmatimonadota bacterium]
MPIEMRLLGDTELTGPDGQSVLPVMAQPKRFALLAYLLLSRPSRLHRRDELLAMFWPELNESHARGALSQALSFLRRSLGEEVVLTRGVELVGIAADQLECDVLRFEAAAEAGDHAKAAALYQGDLLESFHVANCQPFDLWLDGERQRLRDRALRSAKKASREAESRGDDTGGYLSARKAVGLAPYDEASIARLMAALEHEGQRGRALEEYNAFVARMAEELKMQPTAELRALAERIRRGEESIPAPGPTAVPSPQRPQPVPPARAPGATRRADDQPRPRGLSRRLYYVYAAVMIAVAVVAAGVAELLELPAALATLVVLIAALFVPLVTFVLPVGSSADSRREGRRQ